MKLVATLCLLSLVSSSLGDVFSFVDNAIAGAKEAKDFVEGAYGGAGDMLRAYNDMKDANWKNSDKYFHARGNYEAAQRGSGGKWAAEVISDLREASDTVKYAGLSDSGRSDSAADQEANRWGREGGDPNKYRPEGLLEKF